MIVGICSIELGLPGNESLKDKRRVIKPLLIHLRREFNVSVAEVGELDAWRSATIGVAAVSNDAAYVHGLFEKLVRWIQDSHLEVEVQDWQVEII